MGWYSCRLSAGSDARRATGSRREGGTVRVEDGYGAEVVGPCAARWAGAKIRRRACKWFN